MSPTIEDQLALEQFMQGRGADAYRKSQRKAEEKGRGSELDYSRRLMQEYMQPLVEALEAELNKQRAGRYGKARSLLKRVDPWKAMYIAMKGMFNSFTFEEVATSTASRIGRMVEDEIRFSRFQEEFKDYYDSIIKDFKRKGTKDYRYQHRVLTHTANTQDDGWVAWTSSERVDVGMRLLDIILLNTDLVEKKLLIRKKKQEMYLAATPQAKEFVDKHEDHSAIMFADRSPCIVPPDDWTAIDQGGYYSPLLRQNTPMVKTSGALQKALIKKNDLSEVMQALNLQQQVAWSVNHRVLDVLREIWAKDLGIGIPHSEKLEPRESPVKDVPKEQMTEAQTIMLKEWKREASEIYTQEKERVAQAFQVTRVLRMAATYGQYPSFWYVWYADFRGRMYTATASFSPQGPDVAKGLLRFAKGKPLGPDGMYWLQVHIANRYGYDKETYDNRVLWVRERHDVLMAIASDPMGNIHHWRDADKPYQFLAAVFEYAGVHELVALGRRAEEFVSRLPIGLDGSCNGLQNFSAMLRDAVGGKATNLVPQSLPADIYAEVAGVAVRKLRALSAKAHSEDPDSEDSVMAADWVRYADKLNSGKLPRSLAKRPVMTLPYGATRQSCTKYIFEDIIKHKWTKEFSLGPWKAAVWMTSILWASIGEVVIAARAAMSWLQKVANAMTKIDKPLVWKTKDGFIATQNSKEIDSHLINTQLAGRFQVRVGVVSNRLDANKQRSGISPNFVHSQDAAHLRATVREAAKYGITDIACIHDDYGTYAADTAVFQRLIRKAFVDMYRDFNPLEQFAQIAEAYGATIPPMPALGSLDIETVLDSEYFFG